MPRRLSLKTKITLLVALPVLTALTGLGLFSFRYYEAHFKAIIGQQQFTLVSQAAAQIDGQIATARETIVHAAASLPPEVTRDSDQAQAFLDSHLGLAAHTLFDNGIFLFSADGRMIAETPFIPGRRGKDYAFRDYFRRTVAARAPIISAPYFSSQPHHHPAINFTAPVLDAGGRLVAVLAGSLDLTRDNVLGHLAKIHFGHTGYLYLYNSDRLMIMHPDASRILQKDVPPGANRLFDRALEGFTGSGETVNSRGIPMLASFSRLQNVDWILAANYPIEEAYAPLLRARRYILSVLLLALLISTAAVWLLMRRLTAPLLLLISHVQTLAGSSETAPPPLKIDTGDEIGTMAETFNRLMAEIEGQRRNAREQLLFLQTLIDTIPNPIYFKDLTGRYLGFNQAFEQVHGKRPEEVLGRTIFEIAAPELARELHQAEIEFQQCEAPFHAMEKSLIYGDGSRHDVLLYKAIFRNEQGEAAGLVGLFLDISQRKAGELALAEQREFSDNLLQNSAVPCFVVDRSHRVLTWTRACEELTGVPAAEVLGTDHFWKAFYPRRRPCLADLIVDGDHEKVLDLYDSFENSRWIPDGLKAEGWFPNIGGKRRYLLFEAAPIRDRSGRIIAAIETLHDFTSLKHTEQALRESEQSYRSLIERSPDAILVHRDGQIVFGNRSAARLFVASSTNALAGIRLLDLIHPDYRDDVRERIARIELNQQEYPYLEEKILCLDGTTIDVEVGSTPVFYAGRWAVQTILRDITERKEMQEQIWRQANFDPLTGVPNRLLFHDRLQQDIERAERDQHHVALIYLDIDGFKEVNDSFGHSTGDELLRQVAQRLAGTLRRTDTIARMGGDEFTIIMPQVEEPPLVNNLAERILAGLTEPFSIGGYEGSISASLGIAVYPEDGTSIDTLLKRADSAMYAAKQGGRNTFRFFSPDRTIHGQPRRAGA